MRWYNKDEFGKPFNGTFKWYNEEAGQYKQYMKHKILNESSQFSANHCHSAKGSSKWVNIDSKCKTMGFPKENTECVTKEGYNVIIRNPNDHGYENDISEIKRDEYDSMW